MKILTSSFEIGIAHDKISFDGIRHSTTRQTI